MAATIRSAARRARSTKAASACPCWPSGPASSSRAPSSTRSCRPKTGCRRFVAAAGEPDLKEKLLTGYKAGEKTFKNHLDGYNFKPFFEGKVAESPRREFFYFSDNADLMAVRYNEWKITFKTIVGNLFSGKEDSTNVPLVTNLRVDPWERYQTESMSYGEWWGKKLWVMMPAMTIMGQFLATFKEYPPSQVSGSLSVEKALQMVQNGASGGGK